MLSTSPVKEAFRKKKARRLWNFLINTAIESIKKPDCDQEIAGYPSINQLLPSYMGTDECCVKFAMRRAASDMWIKMLGAWCF